MIIICQWRNITDDSRERLRDESFLFYLYIIAMSTE